MQVIIHELVSKVRALDADSVLAPTTLQKIVQTVLQAVEAQEEHGQRVSEEHTLENYQEFTRRGRR